MGKYVSEDPAARLAYCRDLGFGATQESCKSLPAAVARGWPTAAALRALRRPFDDAGIVVAALEPVKEPLASWVEETLAGRDSFEAFARHLDAAGEAGIPCVMGMAETVEAARGAVFDDVARFIDRMCFVHVRDVTLYADGSFAEVMPGRGSVPAAEASRRLWQLGYRGAITPEHTPQVCGETYAGPIATAHAAGWCNAILNDLVARDAAAAREG